MIHDPLTDGAPEPLGVSVDASGLNIAVHSAHAEAMAISLFDAEDRETARLRLPTRTGDVFHGHIAGLGAGTRYGLRAFGPWAPERGHRFNPAKLLIDPFATALDRPLRLHPSLFDTDGPDPRDTAPVMPKAIVGHPEPAAEPDRPLFAWDRQVIYELHVRGFTIRHPDIPPPLRGTFAGLAHPASIGHLKRLGVTTVELMPTAAWIDERHLAQYGLTNYWGYNPVALLVPDPRLAPGGWAEVRAAVDALHASGIAVLVDVVLNHTGEGDHLGPTLSLRGLDNADYYRLMPNDPSRFADDTGCGNTVALDRPAPLRLAIAALRGWALRGGIDGFRIDLATTLGRRANGFDPTAPLLAAIEQDPVLCRRVMIAEPWDIGQGGYQLGAFPARWGEWNDRYRDTVRRFWRGDAGMLGDLATRFAGSADVFGPRHRPLSRSINLVTAHDGFTLADLVSHETRHNEANGENGHDGTHDNLSWNNGAEGATDDPAIQAARRRDRRALLATLLLSRGTPMLSMGDEAGRSQGGNNNAYAQDNALSWFDWDGMDDVQVAFTSRLAALRREHPALSGGQALTGRPIDDSQIPDVAWFLPDGRALGPEDWRAADHRTLVAALYAPGSRVVAVLHGGAAPVDIVLPLPRGSRRWRCVIDSAAPARNELASSPFVLGARSVALLVEEDGETPYRRIGVTGETLDRLAQAAGIAPVWWDVEGREHRVSDPTKQALLAAMRLPAGNAADAADSLARLRAIHERVLPLTLVATAGAPVTVPLGQRPPAWLTLLRADGAVERLWVDPAEAPATVLPPQPIGRHRLLFEDRPETVCHLTVAPARCHLPPDLSAGQRRFGVAAHLYALRRAGDQGIGDFTTLTRLAEAAAAGGAATIGLNPLHALVPGDRTRPSPYHPSDRRFLDPIYIDVAGLPGAADEPFAALGRGAMVDYPGVWDAKRRVLRAAFDAGAGHDPACRAFIAAGGDDLRRFATFEAIAGTCPGLPWWQWPEALRHPRSPAVEQFAASHAAELRFAGFLQYLADRQFGAAADAASRAGLSLGYYRDLAVGAAPDGAEAWSRQDTLLTGASVGAPPDPFAADGQVWCLPPPDPLAMAREGYAGFAALLAANMRHAGALRIDHVMGLQRLFIVPDGASARDGAYLAYPFHDLLGQITLESQAARCLVVGEDLGTVPAGLAEALGAADVLSYRVLWFERDGPRFRPPSSWRRLAAACVSTHDLPTLRGWWEGADINERRALGMLDDAAMEQALAARAADREALIAALREAGLLHEPGNPDGPLTPALAAAVHALVAATPSLLALIQADDLAGEAVAVNLPGTDRERPNWQRRLRPDVATLCRPDGAIWQAFRARARQPGEI